MSTSYPSAYAPHGSLYKFIDPARLVIKDVFSMPNSSIITIHSLAITVERMLITTDIESC